MKTYWIIPVILLMVATSCMRKEHLLVESDYSYRGNFKKYTTFCFADIMQFDGDSSMINPILTESIKSRMELQGYKMSNKKPSLLVFYKIFYKDLKLQGYIQPEIENWVKNENEDVSYDPVKYSLKEGTLLIQLVDAKRNHTVWQGYASGVFDDKAMHDERYLKRAVRLVFDRYRLFAKGFIVQNHNNNTDSENPVAEPEEN